MKRKGLFLIIVTLLFVFVIGCGKKTEEESSETLDVMTLNEDGTYTPKEGDFYIGAIFRYVEEDDLEMDLVCKDGVVVDCGKACFTEGEFLKSDYLGLPYMDAFEKFFEKFGQERNLKNADCIDIEVTEDQDNNRDSILEEFKNLASKIGFPPNKISFVSDPKERFNEKIAEFTKDAVNGRAEDSTEEQSQDVEPNAPQGPLEVASFEEMKKAYESGRSQFVLTGDITIDLSQCSLNFAETDCQGHNVTVKGAIHYEETDQGVTFAVFENPGTVDLSALTVNMDSFDEEKMIGRAYGIQFRNGSYKNLTVPSGIPNRMDGINVAPYQSYSCCEINDDGTEFAVLYCGPSVSYKELQEKEIKVMTAILTEGDADSVLEDPDHRIYEFWTEMEIDVGDVVLPDQDYQMFKLHPGAKLKISGKIALTGGKLDWEVSEPDQLDIRDLTLVKKHPSPDMVKVRFDPTIGINEDLLQAKAASGKIMFNKGDSSFDITIW